MAYVVRGYRMKFSLNLGRGEFAKTINCLLTNADFRAILITDKRKEITMNKKYEERKNSLLPGGKPKWIRCYDNGGKTIDRYTVVFTGNYTGKTGRQSWNLGMSSNPFHPQGFGQHGESEYPIDRPTYGHLGKKIKFDDMPADCQKLVLSDYVYLWNITDHPYYTED